MSFAETLPLSPPVESFERRQPGLIGRTVRRRSGDEHETFLRATFDTAGMSAAEAFDLAWLRATSPPTPPSGSPIRVVDLFAGCGGLSLGVAEACRAIGARPRFVLANDLDGEILELYTQNLGPEMQVDGPVESMFDGELGSVPTPSEQLAFELLRPRDPDSPTERLPLDLLIGGPPCQGHSDFNNHTRNDDPKNSLYMRMARFCEVVQPAHVIIENVPGVERDRHRVAQRTWEALEDLGYAVDSGIVDTSKIGVAQVRRRSITLASKEVSPSVSQAVLDVAVKEARGAMWAIGDLAESDRGRAVDSVTTPNAETRARIDYLFDNGIFNLPNEQRPDCHRLKDHSYVSVYGRMYPEEPAQTLTTGFSVMGRGRFVHPTERRTITPHEAARLQFFPDFFDFGERSRTLLARVIGNAVPPKLGYALGLHLLR